jgi:hypothetical protein
VVERKPEEVVLADGFTVATYRGAVAAEDRPRLAKFLEDRFLERFLNPVHPPAWSARNGFTIMAICCLMIESLETFRVGPAQRKRFKDHLVYEAFFKRRAELLELVPFALEFYIGIRNGTLHYAQTLAGWRIRRDNSALFDAKTLTVEADKFHAAIALALKADCQALREAEWNSQPWINFRDVMDDLCRQAGVRS